MTVHTQVEQEMTIDELARATGVTVRNVRAHQSRGLLPPPAVRGRTGYYGPEHLARLQLIREMQADGFNLSAIKRLLEDSEGAGEQVLRFRRSLLEPFATEEPEVVTAEELAERFGEINPKLARKAEKLGILVPLGDGRFEAPSPALLRAGEEVVAMGVPLDHAVRVLETVMRSSRSVADAFVRLFVQDVLDPARRDGPTAESWAEVSESLERLRPLASKALLAAFEQTMTRRVERAFGEQLKK